MACKGCKRKKRISGTKKGVSISQEDIFWAVGGAAAGIVTNKFLADVKEKLPDAVKENIDVVIPAVKVLGGGYMAMNEDMARNWRFFGVGLAGTGVNELGQKYAPDYFTTISGVNGDVYELIGNSKLIEIPITPSSSLSGGSVGDTDANLFEEEVVMGVDDYMVL